MKRIFLSAFGMSFVCMAALLLLSAPAFAEETTDAAAAAPADETQPAAEEIQPAPPQPVVAPAEETPAEETPAAEAPVLDVSPVVATPAPVAQPAEAEPEPEAAAELAVEEEDPLADLKPVKFDIHVEMLNLFVFRNDADFDRTEQAYDKNGQTVGLLGTFVKPQFGIRLGKVLRFYYEAELGLDLWSRNNPDIALGFQDEDGLALSIKQREMWGEANLWLFGIRAGFQRVQDSSGLFINHWIGALKVRFGEENDSHISLIAGQMPDQTYEGFDFQKNNFTNDTFLFALDGSYVINPMVSLHAGTYYVYDGSVVDRTRHLAALVATAKFKDDSWHAALSLVGQAGRMENSAADGTDSTMLAWGVSANGGMDIGMFSFDAAATVLSADDEHLGNDSLSFFYSGKRPGMSMLLSENEIRDLGDNLDERIAAYDGTFYQMRTGLAGVDLGLYLHPVKWLTVGLVNAGLFVLNSDNAAGASLVGYESEVLLSAHLFGDHLNFTLVGGLLLPGEAASAFVNQIERDATEMMYFTQLSMGLKF